MIKINPVITSVMHTLRIQYPELNYHKGFGFCAFGSELLRRELASRDINADVLVGEKFSNNKEGTDAKEACLRLTNSIPEDDPVEIFAIIKQQFIKRGGTLLKNTGHAVVVVGEVVYDITARQFDKKLVYSLDQFEKTWQTTYLAKVDIDPNNSDTFGVARISKRK